MTAPTVNAAPIPALLPCPFCGKEGAAQGASRGFISVWCGCGARGPEVPFPEDSIDPHIPISECRAAWNRRADREARLSLPDSREEREPTRFPAKAAYARAMDVADRLIERAYGTSMPDEWNEAYRDVQSAVARADRARARQGGNNG